MLRRLAISGSRRTPAVRTCRNGPAAMIFTTGCYRLTVACACGVVFERWVTPEDAGLDLLRAASLN